MNEVREYAETKRWRDAPCNDEADSLSWTDEELEADYDVHDGTVDLRASAETLESKDIENLNEFVPVEWKRLEGDHDIEKDAKAVNPQFDHDSFELSHNCTCCAHAYEMRCRRYDVEANPLTRENAYLQYRPERAWNNPDIQTTEGNGKADIESKMNEWGDGARAEIVVFWKVGDGHIFSAEQVDGKTKFVDSQTVNQPDSYKNPGDYFVDVKEDGSTYFWRTDNVAANPNIQEYCKGAER